VVIVTFVQTGSRLFPAERFEIGYSVYRSRMGSRIQLIDFRNDRHISTYSWNALLTVILPLSCPLSPSGHASRRTCRTKVIFVQTRSSLFLANRFQIDLSCLLKLNGNSYITDRFP